MVLAIALAPLSAAAQVYCSQWAEVIDAPTNVRRAPSGHGSVACQLSQNGLRLLRVPLRKEQQNFHAQWSATMVCRPPGRRSAIGLGQSPDDIHRSQVRLLANTRDDWFAGKDAQGQDPCALLWRAYAEGR